MGLISNLFRLGGGAPVQGNGMLTTAMRSKQNADREKEGLPPMEDPSGGDGASLGDPLKEFAPPEEDADMRAMRRAMRRLKGLE